MKQILFMMPSYYNFDEVIIDGLVKYSGYHVNSIDTVDKRIYKNGFSRVINFLSKIFLNKNLKPEMKRKHLFHEINKFPFYEYLVANRPDTVSSEVLEKAMSMSKESILLLWDSLEKVPISEEIISKFDIVYSFDLSDCEKYGFNKIENFHFFETNVEEVSNDYDIVYLGTLDERIDSLKSVINHLQSQGKKINAQLYIPPHKSFAKFPNIHVLKKIIPFKESSKLARSSKAILDLAHVNQAGLSFRFFEAMAFRKKIITTNKNVIQYDFYNEKNIFVIEDVNNIKIPNSFWDTDYCELPTDLVEKYHIKNWVKKIVNER